MKEIPLTKGKIAIVDAIDYEWLNQWNWCYNGKRHAIRGERRGGRYKAISMHREIMKPPPGFVVDHINGDGLDNRRQNLRICTTKQNNQNQSKHRDNTSGYRGVYFVKASKKWQASIRIDGKNYHQGLFEDPKEAALAYNKAAVEAWGEFAKLNPV